MDTMVADAPSTLNEPDLMARGAHALVIDNVVKYFGVEQRRAPW